MKINILVTMLLFLVGQMMQAAYSANDYLFPKLHNTITLKSNSGNTLKVSHTYVYDTFGKQFNSIRSASSKSLSIKEYKRSVVFLFTLNGSNVKLKNYELESSSYFVSNANAEEKTWFSIPEEAWSTKESKFIKPTSSGTTLTSKSSFKKVKAKNGTEIFL